MGRLGSTPADGCAPLGEHLLGSWVALGDSLDLGDASGRSPDVGVLGGVSLSDGRAGTIGSGIVDHVSVGESRAMAVAQALVSSVDVGDAISRVWAAVRACSDGARLSDSKLLGQMLLGELLDQPDIVLQLGKDVNDTVSMGDALARVWDALRAYADELVVDDGAVHAIGLAPEDGVTLSDEESLLLALALTLLARSGGFTLDGRSGALTLPERGG